MKILSDKKQREGMNHIINVMSIMETIPIEYLGNSADGLVKLQKMYEEMAELSYIVDGVRGLNTGVAFFDSRARSFDEMLAISKAHLKVVKNHTEDKR